MGLRRTPSPRVRGEGWGEGAYPLGSESRRAPATRRVELVIGPATAAGPVGADDLSPRAGRGEK